MDVAPLRQTLDQLYAQSQAKCTQVTQDIGLIHDLYLLAKRAAHLNSDACWTETEAAVVLSCLQMFEFAEDCELIQYGIVALITRVLQKANDQINKIASMN